MINNKKINDIVIEGKKYKYKIISKDSNGKYNLNRYFSSIIIKYMSDLINVECCDVNLANLDDNLIMLIPNYKKSNCIYVNGQDIIENYLDYLEKNKLLENYFNQKFVYPLNDYQKAILINKMDNLKTIKEALKFHYKNNIGIASNIFQEFIKRYFFDYMVMLDDRHLGNWEIEETINNAKMVPAYDNDSKFNYLKFIPKTKIDMNDNEETDILEKLFLTFGEYNMLFLEIYNTLTPNRVIELLNQIERDRNFEFPTLYKEEFINNYSENYMEITQTLTKLNLIEGGLKHE